MRIPYQELNAVFLRVLARTGLEPDRAELCARLFTDASRDGVASHGLNRFPRFIRTIERGIVDVRACPELVAARGALERWDGRRGPTSTRMRRTCRKAHRSSRRSGGS
jgi:3-dehydro-L-gulonate 2-dehydrogenase